MYICIYILCYGTYIYVKRNSRFPNAMPSSVHDFNCFLEKSRSSGPERVSKVHVVWSVRDYNQEKKNILHDTIWYYRSRKNEIQPTENEDKQSKKNMTDVAASLTVSSGTQQAKKVSLEDVQ
jgi:hypothetical protein